ncbi:SIR2 family protein [Leifsonia sp. TF02-11]|uniref:SIR2 family protein n=1 Tax=Leifsonia sp. TF02-11 TaxID=2815212 RepID=UPI001AA14E5C|nr:SIR2 family protein [Leifsonia sp. TF02-11]MBO1740738.1 SIR2 family protein [Leifsonia sp. TF02-11]
MAVPLSPVVALATSMQAQPGVYAVLLGSGVSTAAGIPTGWGVVRELVRRVAAATPDDDDAPQLAWEDPADWWAEHGQGELGYATLLEQLGPTAAARQGLLAAFFEPSYEEREEGLKQPTKAHIAIAELVKRGYVRVVITTNFDRLMEQALEAVGVSPQVIARPEAVNGMAPLAHAPATVIKLHGDYKDLGTRNTPEELGAYPEEWTRLLAQVFDEYGVVIAGWSAEWDDALVAAIESTPSRRYPLYWDGRSSRGETAQRILAGRAGLPIPTASADDLFTELLGSLDALERLADPPLSTAMAVARLKRYLPDPVRRIDLHDLVMRTVDEVVGEIAAQPMNVTGQVTFELLQSTYEAHFRAMNQLAALLITGVWHDDSGVHDRLWLDVLQRLTDAALILPTSAFNDALLKARRFPAFIALAVMGVAGMRRGRDELLIKLATQVEGRDRIGADELMQAAQLLHYRRLADPDWIKKLPRWESQWLYPSSHLFVTDLRVYFADFIPVDEDFVQAYRDFEYRLGLIQERTRGYHAIDGEYVGEWAWDGDVPRTENALRRELARSGSDVWSDYYGGTDELEEALIAHREVLVRYQRWG